MSQNDRDHQDHSNDIYGKLEEAFEKSLGTDPPPTEPADVTSASPADHVRDMQRLIGCRADGAWGPITTMALANFQRSTRIPMRPLYGAEERAARASLVKGIDISQWQYNGEKVHHGVDFQKVRAAGYEFVVIRANYGPTPDIRANYFWDEAGRAGLLRMGYTFQCAGLPVAAQVTTAERVLPQCLGWWVDVEPDGTRPIAHTRAEVDQMLTRLAATSFGVGPYSAWGWWEGCGLGTLKPSNPIWNAGPNNGHLYGGATKWFLWQEKVGHVPGVTGYNGQLVDCDIDWCSDRELLLKWAV